MDAPETHPPGHLFPSSTGGKIARSVLNSASGAIPGLGGFLAAAAAAWSEHEQEKVNRLLHAWFRMVKAQLEEQGQTIAEVMARVDIHDEEISQRIESKAFQSLMRKALREWAAAESDQKRIYIRNILVNAASATTIVSDDVVKLFLDWLRTYSELHFSVIAVIYNNAGITRGQIWQQLGKQPVREDTADADLFKLLIHDLSTGRIIRQHRETDYMGNFIKKQQHRPAPGQPASRTMVSAFDNSEGYELTGLGQQFVHYAMTDVPPKLEFRTHENESAGFV